MQRRQTAKTTAGPRSSTCARRIDQTITLDAQKTCFFGLQCAGGLGRRLESIVAMPARTPRPAAPGIDALLEHVRRGEIARVAIFKLVQIGNTG